MPVILSQLLSRTNTLIFITFLILVTLLSSSFAQRKQQLKLRHHFTNSDYKHQSVDNFFGDPIVSTLHITLPDLTVIFQNNKGFSGHRRNVIKLALTKRLDTSFIQSQISSFRPDDYTADITDSNGSRKTDIERLKYALYYEDVQISLLTTTPRQRLPAFTRDNIFHCYYVSGYTIFQYYHAYNATSFKKFNESVDNTDRKVQEDSLKQKLKEFVKTVVQESFFIDTDYTSNDNEGNIVPTNEKEALLASLRNISLNDISMSKVLDSLDDMQMFWGFHSIDTSIREKTLISIPTQSPTILTSILESITVDKSLSSSSSNRRNIIGITFGFILVSIATISLIGWVYILYVRRKIRMQEKQNESPDQDLLQNSTEKTKPLARSMSCSCDSAHEHDPNQILVKNKCKKLKRFIPQLALLNINPIDDEDNLLESHNHELGESSPSHYDSSSSFCRLNMTRIITSNNFNFDEQQEEHELILNDPISYGLEEVSIHKDKQEKKIFYSQKSSKSVQEAPLPSIDHSFIPTLPIPPIPPSKHDVTQIITASTDSITPYTKLTSFSPPLSSTALPPSTTFISPPSNSMKTTLSKPKRVEFGSIEFFDMSITRHSPFETTTVQAISTNYIDNCLKEEDKEVFDDPFQKTVSLSQLHSPITTNDIQNFKPVKPPMVTMKQYPSHTNIKSPKIHRKSSSFFSSSSNSLSSLSSIDEDTATDDNEDFTTTMDENELDYKKNVSPHDDTIKNLLSNIPYSSSSPNRNYKEQQKSKINKVKLRDSLQNSVDSNSSILSFSEVSSTSNSTGATSSIVQKGFIVIDDEEESNCIHENIIDTRKKENEEDIGNIIKINNSTQKHVYDKCAINNKDIKYEIRADTPRPELAPDMSTHTFLLSSISRELSSDIESSPLSLYAPATDDDEITSFDLCGGVGVRKNIIGSTKHHINDITLNSVSDIPSLYSTGSSVNSSRIYTSVDMSSINTTRGDDISSTSTATEANTLMTDEDQNNIANNNIMAQLKNVSKFLKRYESKRKQSFQKKKEERKASTSSLIDGRTNDFTHMCNKTSSSSVEFMTNTDKSSSVTENIIFVDARTHKKDNFTALRATITEDDGYKSFDLDAKITTRISDSLSDFPQMRKTNNLIKSTTECSNRACLSPPKQKSLNTFPRNSQLRNKKKKKKKRENNSISTSSITTSSASEKKPTRLEMKLMNSPTNKEKRKEKSTRKENVGRYRPPLHSFSTYSKKYHNLLNEDVIENKYNMDDIEMTKEALVAGRKTEMGEKSLSPVLFNGITHTNKDNIRNGYNKTVNIGDIVNMNINNNAISKSTKNGTVISNNPSLDLKYFSPNLGTPSNNRILNRRNGSVLESNMEVVFDPNDESTALTTLTGDDIYNDSIIHSSAVKNMSMAHQITVDDTSCKASHCSIGIESESAEVNNINVSRLGIVPFVRPTKEDLLRQSSSFSLPSTSPITINTQENMNDKNLYCTSNNVKLDKNDNNKNIIVVPKSGNKKSSNVHPSPTPPPPHPSHYQHQIPPSMISETMIPYKKSDHKQKVGNEVNKITTELRPNYFANYFQIQQENINMNKCLIDELSTDVDTTGYSDSGFLSDTHTYHGSSIFSTSSEGTNNYNTIFRRPVEKKEVDGQFKKAMRKSRVLAFNVDKNHVDVNDKTNISVSVRSKPLFHRQSQLLIPSLITQKDSNFYNNQAENKAIHNIHLQERDEENQGQALPTSRVSNMLRRLQVNIGAAATGTIMNMNNKNGNSLGERDKSDIINGSDETIVSPLRITHIPQTQNKMLQGGKSDNKDMNKSMSSSPSKVSDVFQRLQGHINIKNLKISREKLSTLSPPTILANKLTDENYKNIDSKEDMGDKGDLKNTIPSNRVSAILQRLQGNLITGSNIQGMQQHNGDKKVVWSGITGTGTKCKGNGLITERLSSHVFSRLQYIASNERSHIITPPSGLKSQDNNDLGNTQLKESSNRNSVLPSSSLINSSHGTLHAEIIRKEVIPFSERRPGLSDDLVSPSLVFHSQSSRSVYKVHQRSQVVQVTPDNNVKVQSQLPSNPSWPVLEKPSAMSNDIQNGAKHLINMFESNRSQSSSAIFPQSEHWQYGIKSEGTKRTMSPRQFMMGSS